ncbi:RluA family pseudouridine synthase [Patescibacteria group bacterium]|nr:RluA family pseudouridine synthase [Patescibacteria group bacterium]
MMLPKIIYQDDCLLVLDKPPGLVVDPADSVKEETLADILVRDFNIKLFRGGIVHRLDKDTSGIILVAKTQEALDNLQNQFKERDIKKEYLALVHGLIEEKGEVVGSIGRNPGNREKFTVLEGGKEAVTEYEPAEKFKVQSLKFKVWFPDFNKIQMRKLERQNYGEFTLLKCKPKTGRTHQIRVHLKYINHPIVSDEKYVGRKMYRLDKRWCDRMFLHAAKIGFNHPVSGEWMELESELPEDLKTALVVLSS